MKRRRMSMWAFLFHARSVTLIALFLGLLLLGGREAAWAQNAEVSIVSDSAPSSPVQHGLEELLQALKQEGITVERVQSIDKAKGERLVVAGLAKSEGLAAQLLQSTDQQPQKGKESLLITRTEVQGRSVLLISGTDPRGLMYALLDVADRVGWSNGPDDPFASVESVRQSPELSMRSIVKMVAHPDEFERYAFNEAYWDRYFSMLARDRYNNFTLLFGYESQGYFYPVFPWLFEVEGFPTVRVEGVNAEKREKYMNMLRMVAREAHEHGLQFTMALWTHKGGRYTKGLNNDNLMAYSEAALAKMIRLMPDLDRIEFRVHVESSLTLAEQREFWRRMLGVVEESDRHIEVRMRVKGFTDDLIETALASGGPVKFITKFWGEKLGMPFHPTHLEPINQFRRRHGYANMLRYPKKYDMVWRIWSHGTVRLLHFFNPAYVRSFVSSAHLYDGTGFEIFEPLANKLWHWAPTDAVDHFEVFKKPYRFYEWEFERYWPYYLIFGRLSYNPDTSPQVWLNEFKERFGAKAGPRMAEALAEASDVLPRRLGYSTRINATAGGDLPETGRTRDLRWYVSADNSPGDDAVFASMHQAALMDIAGKPTPRVHPRETSQWFMKKAKAIAQKIERAESAAGAQPSPEFVSMLADLKILAGLARYHSHRIKAGLDYAVYKNIGDLHALDEAIQHNARAIDAWERIVAAAESVYSDSLMFEEDLHWRTELEPLREEQSELRAERAQFSPPQREPKYRFDFGEGPAVDGWHAVRYESTYTLAEGGWGWLRRNTYFLPAPSLGPQRAETTPMDDFARGPEQYNYSMFRADMTNGSYRLTFQMQDTSTAPQDYGPMWFIVNGIDETDRFTVAAGERVEKVIDTFVNDGHLNVIVQAESDGTWLLNAMTVTPVGPRIVHRPITRAEPGQPTEIWTTVHGVNPIEKVTLIAGNDVIGYSRQLMERVSEYVYRGRLPAASDSQTLHYAIQAVDSKNHHGYWPGPRLTDDQKVMVSSDTREPAVEHTSINEVSPDESLRIVAKVNDSSGVKWARLRYRSVNQYQDYYTLPMKPTGRPNEYAATIPSDRIPKEWSLQYYIEAMDEIGNGCIFPGLDAEAPYVVVEPSTRFSAARRRATPRASR